MSSAKKNSVSELINYQAKRRGNRSLLELHIVVYIFKIVIHTIYGIVKK